MLTFHFFSLEISFAFDNRIFAKFLESTRYFPKQFSLKFGSPKSLIGSKDEVYKGVGKIFRED